MTTKTSVEADLDELLGRFVADLGGTAAAGNIVLGDRLGLYRALAEAGPINSDDLATYTGTAERYVREWLRGQAAGGVVEYRADTDQYWMTEPQVLAYASPDGLALPGAFQLALACFASLPAIERAFRTGEGFAWGSHKAEVFTGCERFFRPGYVANLLSSWIPAIDGLNDRLTGGISVVDVGCGLGTSTRLLAGAYPKSTFLGIDSHPESIELARRMTDEAGLGDRCRFEVARAQEFAGTEYGLIATFDCLHDMGDPVGAARHIRQALSSDGVWMIVEPFAEATVSANLTPVGRVYYSLSSFLCVPHAVSEGADNPLGNQAGETPIAQIADRAGFGSFRRVAETAFNIVYVAQP